MVTTSFALRAALLAAGLVAFGAGAQAAPKAKAQKAPASIEIDNQRTARLTSFEIATGDADAKIVGKLAKPLPAGKKIRLPLKGAKGCDFIARWQFEDAGDEGQVDLCNDPKIVLTD